LREEGLKLAGVGVFESDLARQEAGDSFESQRVGGIVGEEDDGLALDAQGDDSLLPGQRGGDHAGETPVRSSPTFEGCGKRGGIIRHTERSGLRDEAGVVLVELSSGFEVFVSHAGPNRARGCKEGSAEAGPGLLARCSV
jgi:hypothetical protein